MESWEGMLWAVSLMLYPSGEASYETVSTEQRVCELERILVAGQSQLLSRKPVTLTLDTHPDFVCIAL